MFSISDCGFNIFLCCCQKSIFESKSSRVHLKGKAPTAKLVKKGGLRAIYRQSSVKTRIKKLQVKVPYIDSSLSVPVLV